MGSVATWAAEDKVLEAMSRSPDHMPDDVARTFRAMVSGTNLAIMAGTLVIWAASHFFGVGEIVDVGLLLIGAFTIGWSIGDVADKLYEFATIAMDAQDDRDLDRAAQAFADAVVMGSIDVIMAILLKKSAWNMQEARAAMLGRTPSVSELVRIRNTTTTTIPEFQQAIADWPRGQLPEIPDPQPGARWYQPSTIGTLDMPAGTGKTDWYGNITVSLQGSAEDIQLALAHEQGHSWLSPRFYFARSVRASLKASGYYQSVFLRYTEEALAETTAQLRVNGYSGIMTGIKFPVVRGYVTASSLVSEGMAIGTVAAGTQWFVVQFSPGEPGTASDLVCRPPEPVCR